MGEILEHMWFTQIKPREHRKLNIYNKQWDGLFGAIIAYQQKCTGLDRFTVILH